MMLPVTTVRWGFEEFLYHPYLRKHYTFNSVTGVCVLVARQAEVADDSSNLSYPSNSMCSGQLPVPRVYILLLGDFFFSCILGRPFCLQRQTTTNGSQRAKYPIFLCHVVILMCISYTFPTVGPTGVSSLMA